MFEIYFKATIAFIMGLSLGGIKQTHKKIKNGDVQWVAWKGKHDSIYFEKQKIKRMLKKKKKNDFLVHYQKSAAY